MNKRIKHFRGFTMVELTLVLIVLAVIGIYAGLTLPGRDVNIQAQADRLATDIRYLQALAGTRYERLKITFTSNTYSFKDSSNNAINNPATNTASVTLDSGITFSPVPGDIIFDTRGVPYDSLGTALTSDTNIVLTSTDGNETVTITPETGRVRVQ